jgi:propanol-preferring alcohol dehydrogenase
VAVLKAALLREIAEIKTEDGSRKYPELQWREEPLDIVDISNPMVLKNQVLIHVESCGVCYTDIDIVEGRVKCRLPIVLGHQIVGRVAEVGGDVYGVSIGDRVGVAWIGWSCGKCSYCLNGFENLCYGFKATGCDLDGGYAEYTVAFASYIYMLPNNVEAEKLAPLMCAGSIGYRAYRLADIPDGARVGLFGFGSSAHIVIQIIRALKPSVEIYVFSRGLEHRELAKRLGADWVGHPSEDPPKKINRAIDFTPIGETVARAMELLDRGGKLIVNAIRKQTPITLDYAKHLWEEKEVRSVANVTRSDVRGFIEFVKSHSIEIHVQSYRLEEANKALRDLKAAKTKGAPVLKIH